MFTRWINVNRGIVKQINPKNVRIFRVCGVKSLIVSVFVICGFPSASLIVTSYVLPLSEILAVARRDDDHCVSTLL
jgi:hypothetical protein